MGFGTMLKTLREKSGLSQSELAKKAGLPLRSIQNWEQGHRMPRVQALPRLAKVLGVPLEQLITSVVQDRLEAVQPPPKGKKGRKPKK
jgi:transcriptional regulator with XRE-family HTH domain